MNFWQNFTNFVFTIIPWGEKLKGKSGLWWGENGFCVFSKTDSLQKCVIVGGKRKKYSKSPNFVQLKTHQRMCSDDENQFQTRLAHVRTCFQHYFENFEEKVEIGHFGFWHPYGKSIGVPKAKVTDLSFPSKFSK